MLRNILSLVKNTKFLYILLLCVNLCVIIYHISNKKAFHTDEQWSYAHANSHKGAFLDKEMDSYFKVNESIKNRMFNKWLDSSFFYNYITVQKNETFTYYNIYKNLSQGVHPPLYYILLHTISSFYPNTFNKWQAGALNLTIFILIYIMLFKLSKLLLKDERLALCVIALWGFSKIGIDTVIFIRMYILQTLWAICLVYQSLKILENNIATKKDLFLVFLYSFLGIFTQYNSIFFSFLVSVVTCLILLKRKQYKLMFYYGVAMLFSVCILFIAFPHTYNVLLNSQRGTELLSKIEYNSYLISFLSLFNDKNKILFKIIFNHLLAFNFDNNKLSSIIAFIVIMSVFSIFYFKIKFKTTTMYLISIILLYAFYLIYMPDMFDYTNRYYMIIIPYIAILIISSINYILNSIRLKSNYIFITLAMLIFINSFFYNYKEKSAYAFTLTKEEIQIIKKLKNKKVFLNAKYTISKNDILIQNPIMIGWIHSLSYILKDANNVFISDGICKDYMKDIITENSEAVILTPLTWSEQSIEDENLECLKELKYRKYKLCATEFCNYVWKK